VTVRRFVPWPDKRLRTPAELVAEVNETVAMIWDDMVETMDTMPGYGLAAPQIGIMLRLAVVDCSDRRGQAVKMANPEVLHASVQMRRHAEASPNLPGASAMIERPRAVTVRFLNAQGAVEERDFVALWATSVQHQIDHLNGRMFIDHLSPLRRKMLVQRAAKRVRNG
jgi:peptide deformylase